MKERKDDWMRTYTGKKFWPFDPRPEDIDIYDIAHSLSLQCRFNGHCKVFYSVAQHSVLVSEIVKHKQAFPALLHDAPESYLGDIIQPLKKNLKEIHSIEKRLLEIILEHFGIEDYNQDEIHKADKILLVTEMRDFMTSPPEIWEESKLYQPLSKKIIPLSCKKAERLFLKRYAELK